MTKEEYLNMYKEDKLAEICAQLEEERDGYKKQILELKMKCEQLDVWDDIWRLFEKLEKLPAKDFVKLYYLMDNIMKNKPAIITTLDSISYDSCPPPISQTISTR